MYLLTCSQQRLKSRQSDQSFHCLHEETCILGYPKSTQWIVWSDSANVQADLNLHWAHMSKDMFSTHIWLRFIITKTYLYNFNPLKLDFYIVKLGFTGVYIFLFLLKNIDCGYSLELPQQGSSNKYPQSMYWAEIWKILEFLSENFQFLVVKFSIYLNRCVFLMECLLHWFWLVSL